MAAREVFISAYRARAGRRGISLPARQLGKWKTTFQLVAVGTALCPLTEDTPWIALSLLWGAVGLALVSGPGHRAQRMGVPRGRRPRRRHEV